MSEKKEQALTVDFESHGPGTCHWCRKQREDVYEVTFHDKSFVGLYCWKDLQRAVDTKTPERKAKQQTIPMAAVAPK